MVKLGVNPYDTILESREKHLPGQHDQQSHGGEGAVDSTDEDRFLRSARGYESEASSRAERAQAAMIQAAGYAQEKNPSRVRGAARGASDHAYAARSAAKLARELVAKAPSNIRGDVEASASAAAEFADEAKKYADEAMTYIKLA